MADIDREGQAKRAKIKMKLRVLAAGLWLLGGSAMGESAPHADLQINASSVVLNGKEYADDSSLKTALLELANQSPKPAIYVGTPRDVAPTLPSSRFIHLMDILQGSGLKVYLIGHESPN